MARQVNQIAMIINDAIRNPHLPCRDAIRAFLRDNPGEWSAEALVKRLNCLREQPFRFDRAATTRALNALTNDGELEKSGDGTDATFSYRAAEHDGSTGAKILNAAENQNFEQLIWNAILALKTFSLSEVVMTANTERNYTQRYLQRLLDAKFIIRTGNRRDTFRFNHNRNIGPKAPYLALSLVLVDRNSEKIINVIDSEETAPWT